MAPPPNSRALGAGLAALLLAAAPAAAQQAPRSAIDWLKQPPDAGAPAAEAPPAGEVEAVSIGVAALDSAGTLADAAGVGLEFWDGVEAEEARSLLTRVRAGGALSATRLYRRILLTRARAPLGVGPGGAFLRLRVERLLQAGFLADARALLEEAGARGPSFAEFALAIGQLTGDDLGPCAAALADEATPIARESRIYCMIRMGDADGARAGIADARAGAAIGAQILDLLEAQISPDLAATVTGPDEVARLSPLALALIDGVGAPRPADFAAAPLAYAWADLVDAAPPRDQLAAAERLARAGALSPDRLVAQYRRHRSAESGGVWGRVEAWRAMEAAAPEDVAAAVLRMDDRARDAGLRAVLAPDLHRAARAADPATLDAAARDRLAEIALLAGDPAGALALAPGPERLQALAAILLGEDRVFPGLAARARRGELDAQQIEAARAALLGTAPSVLSDPPARAALEALAQLDAGSEIDQASFGEALAGLVAAGFAEEARAIAVETLLNGRPR